MKTHAIIPIFIPHRGCPHDCVFCNQRKITAKLAPVTTEEVTNTINTWLTTLDDIDTVEVAFFGGSFTAIPIDEQTEYLKIAKKYKDKGLIDKIHLSTRPDAIDKKILNNLKSYGVDVIELGVQSFDDKVLALSERGHNSEVVYKSSKMIKEYGFTLGIQLMIGLPGDSADSCIYSAKETVKIAPDIARLYPTVIIEDTKLYSHYLSGNYSPLPENIAVERTKNMYRILTDAGINVIRVGLKSSDIINEEGTISNYTFHPAFRQLVEGEIAKEEVLNQLNKLEIPNIKKSATTEGEFADYTNELYLVSNPKSFSNLIGHKGCNKKFFKATYPQINFSYKTDYHIPQGEYLVKEKF